MLSLFCVIPLPPRCRICLTPHGSDLLVSANLSGRTDDLPIVLEDWKLQPDQRRVACQERQAAEMSHPAQQGKLSCYQIGMACANFLSSCTCISTYITLILPTALLAIPSILGSMPPVLPPFPHVLFGIVEPILMYADTISSISNARFNISFESVSLTAYPSFLTPFLPTPQMGFRSFQATNHHPSTFSQALGGPPNLPQPVFLSLPARTQH